MFSLNRSLLLATIACTIAMLSTLSGGATESVGNKNEAQLSMGPMDQDYLNKLILSQLEPSDKYPKDSQMKKKFSSNKRSEFDQESPNRQQQKQEYLQANKQKVAIKKKWHKLVDSLIDSEFSSSDSSYPQSARSQEHQYDRSYKKKRWLSNGIEDDKNIVIIMKKPLTPDEDNMPDSNNGDLSKALLKGSANTASLWDLGNQRRGDSISSRPPVDLNEHHRKVLQDSFNVRKDSMFSTNNHLGLKGVPKFGSDDEY